MLCAAGNLYVAIDLPFTVSICMCRDRKSLRCLILYIRATLNYLPHFFYLQFSS